MSYDEEQFLIDLTLREAAAVKCSLYTENRELQDIRPRPEKKTFRDMATALLRRQLVALADYDLLITIIANLARGAADKLPRSIAHKVSSALAIHEDLVGKLKQRLPHILSLIHI